MKWQYWAAGAACLMLPAVFLGGMAFTAAIDPEWAHHTAHYVLVFTLLNDLKHVLMLATFGVSCLLWLSVFVLALKGKGRSLGWTALAALGPLGLLGLAFLRDASAAPDAYERWRSGLGWPLRLVFEGAFFLAVWEAAYRAVLFYENIQILLESRATGTPVAQIVAVRNQSSGMWAFGEAIQQFFLIAMAYAAWPIAFNLAAKARAALSRPR